MDELLLEVSARTLAFTAVEGLLHAFVAGLIPLVVLIEKSIHRFGVILLALVGYRIDFVSLIFRTRYLLLLFGVREIALSATAHRGSFVKVRISIGIVQTWLHCLVLMWN